MHFFLNVEVSFLQIGSKYSLQLIKKGTFHFTGNNRGVVLTGAKGSNRVTLIHLLRVLSDTRINRTKRSLLIEIGMKPYR